MFRCAHRPFCFEDSRSEFWTENEDLNPLTVDRLGYRSNESIILEFIRAGSQLVESRDGYTDDEDFTDYDDYFEKNSCTVDSLHDLQENLERSQERSESSDFSTASSAQAQKEKSARAEETAVVKSETSPDSEEE